jgi:2-polyprenyl-3-methyl-5-hydroxy-6-metoxy-1,4-benzoquinol methylase
LDLIEVGVKDPIKHWYYQHKYWFISQSKLWENKDIKSLVDIGAGSALFSKELLRQDFVNNVVAIDTGYEIESESKGGITYRRSANYSGFTHFLLTDVLEHVDNDEEFLKEIVSEADSNSVFLITVPALMSLWSGHDVYLKHFRRYTKLELRQLAEQSGLSIASIRYTYSSVFPLAYLARKIAGNDPQNSHLRENSWLVSLILRILLLPDRRISFLPFGISLFLVATKDE